jgi:hypothetical protein
MQKSEGFASGTQFFAVRPLACKRNLECAYGKKSTDYTEQSISAVRQRRMRRGNDFALTHPTFIGKATKSKNIIAWAQKNATL